MSEKENLPNPEQEKLVRETFEAIKNSEVIYSIDFVSVDTYRKIFDEQGDLKGKKIIDLAAGFVPIGAGQGSRYFETLAHRGAALIPVEGDFKKARSWRMLSPDMLTEEERSLVTTKVEPLQGNIFQLPFKSGSIDGALSINFFNLPFSDKKEHITMLLQELHRVLNDKGFAVISNFGYFKQTSPDGTVSYNNNIKEDEIIKAEQLKQAAQSAGFKVADLPLDKEKIRWAQADLVKQAQEKDSKIKKVEIIEPSAIFLTK
ncbi:MAG TPA: methyltransferase domain-containing protein [Patescibacteria group bacterium]|jgi:SAM-dependent methyltransferase|nr:methyltransferase domain-containing protein [Patescibacteria group bacterium]